MTPIKPSEEIKVGDCVEYCGSAAIGKCSGVIEKIVETYDHLGHKLSPDEWKAVVRVRTLPKLWPYVGRDTFAPVLGRLTLTTR